MKKVISMVLSVALLLVLGSCTFADTTAFSYSVGDIITFGHYPGAQLSPTCGDDIDWFVLDIVGDMALIMSRYSLVIKEFDEASSSADWEIASIRTWLNEDFFNCALTEEEKNEVSFSEVVFRDCFRTTRTTYDKVFLLSQEEIYRYLPESYRRTNAFSNGAWQNMLSDANFEFGWWLRDSADTDSSEYDITFVDDFGNVNTVGRNMRTRMGIRPAMWINIRNPYVRPVVFFGNYEQDHDHSNGAEVIEWLVLDENADGQELLLSRNAIESKPYDEGWRGSGWEASSIRSWLNNRFLESFSDLDRIYILDSLLYQDANSMYATPGCGSTTDKVFLLSIAEAEKYLPALNARLCGVTQYAADHGAKTEGGACNWLLRTPGQDSGKISFVNNGGWVNYEGDNSYASHYGIRPAMWADIR